MQMEQDFSVQGNCVRIMWDVKRQEARKGWRQIAIVRDGTMAKHVVKLMDSEAPGVWVWRIESAYIRDVNL